MKKQVQLPNKVELTKQDLMELLGEFRKNDVAKTQCGLRLVNQHNQILDEVEAYIRSLP